MVGGDWNMTFIFQYIGNVIIPIDELIFFGGVETTNQYNYASVIKHGNGKSHVNEGFTRNITNR